MISVELDAKQFEIDMTNVVNYSQGFLQGVEEGKSNFLSGLAKTTIESLKQFIDSNARVDPAMLHHVYEWYEIGNPDARLFDITSASTKTNIIFNSSFTQSKTLQHGSNVPFWNKAMVMENGMAVTITPRGNNPLVFEDGGQTIFSKAPIMVENPGGTAVQGAYQKTFDLFFQKYFSQSFLKSSGIIDYIQNPVDFKNNLAAGKKGGMSVGKDIGYKWITKAGEM